jgi:hypothetical protein
VHLGPECRALRQRLRALEWVVLEDVALDAVLDPAGRALAATSAHRRQSRCRPRHCGPGPDAAARRGPDRTQPVPGRRRPLRTLGLPPRSDSRHRPGRSQCTRHGPTTHATTTSGEATHGITVEADAQVPQRSGHPARSPRHGRVMNTVLANPPRLHAQHDRGLPPHRSNIGRAPQQSSPEGPRPQQPQTRATWVAPNLRAVGRC